MVFRCVQLIYIINYLLDIDECATDRRTCDTNAMCNNKIGSFLCTCNTGYTGNGITCEGMLCEILFRHVP